MMSNKYLNSSQQNLKANNHEGNHYHTLISDAKYRPISAEKENFVSGNNFTSPNNHGNSHAHKSYASNSKIKSECTE